MDSEKAKDYWLEEAGEAIRVGWHLYQKDDYSYALFFGHLAIEKLLKAVYVAIKSEQAPYTHNLLRLAESANLTLTEKRRDQLMRITGSNLESRYPDEKRSFRKKCTPEYTRDQLGEIEEVFQWLESMLR